MKLILYECKKILKVPLLLILMLFTLLFYNMFMDIQHYPDDNADLVAEVDLADILMDKYKTSLPFSEIGILQEIKQQQLQTLDSLVQNNDVLQNAGITNYQQLRTRLDREMEDIETVDEKIEAARSEILFETGIREAFLYQKIETIEEHMQYAPFMGIEKGKEEEAAKKIGRSIGDDDSDEAGCHRIAKVIARNEMSLLPTGAFNRTSEDSSKLGVLMMFSCLLLILPYQIRERLAHVNPLFVTTNTGRTLWMKRYLSALLTCFFICLLQACIFLVVLKKVGILKYVLCPASGNGWDYLWFDMSFGIYLTLNIGITILCALAFMTIFYLISRIALNYIVGLAIGLPTAVIIAMLYICIMSYFMFVANSIWRLYAQIGLVLGTLLLATVIVAALYFGDRKRDVMV